MNLETLVVGLWVIKLGEIMANPRRIYGGFTVNGVAMGGPSINGEFSSHV